MTSTGEAVAVRHPGQDTPARPRWRVFHDQMADLKPGDLIRYEELGELVGLDFLDPRHKQAILAAARRAAAELLGQRKVFSIVRGHGYQLAEPDQVIELARQHQSRAVAEVEAGRGKVETIDLRQLDVTTARLVEATAMAFNRQALLMRHLDVRQDRLEKTMAAIGVTVQAVIGQVEQTSGRVDTTEAEIAQLRRRLTELESPQRGQPQPTNSLPPGNGQ
ncbi:hypothetical protein O7627_36870 [Solwaraspora sp. WMMD1047]|uniref:hypothetical protein n=1 Tax=Solwaraspora sp. WMMD1047 TaxID=3016102 RepID=UPI0024168840|nr:hypothetical protein [Solwaraspora sp. WMMD1047]MDG4834844.1 hypothetical protein [Solwaraspora sp. WMMD1047]